MKNKTIQEHEERIIESTLNRMYDDGKRLPESWYWILVVVYFMASFVVGAGSNAHIEISIHGEIIPFHTFAGVLSSLANICVIFLAVYYDKKGFYTGLTVLLIQMPIILINILVRDNTGSLPGLFSNVMAIIAIMVVYLNNQKIGHYQKKLRDVAVTDLLTGIPNGFACDELVNTLTRKHEPFANVSINLNAFKSINDTMGFDAGNQILMDTAYRLKSVAESGSTGTFDFVGRTSGDEFSLIIRGYSSPEELYKVIQIYDEAINKQYTVLDCDLFVSASFGYALYPEDGDTLDAVISHSNIAMNEVKRVKNSNHILRYTEDLNQNKKVLEIEGKIRSAIDNDRVFFMLQPQFDMDHRLRGFEALARMTDKDGTIINPGEFIPVAEKVGLIDKIDGIIYKKAGAFIGEHIKKTGTKITLSINVSVKHLMKKDFIDEITSLLKTTGIPAEQLEVEITESVMIESLDKAISRINELHTMGIKIAIDDFGTGYSSLSYLSEFPATLLKIDKAFIDKLLTGEKSKQYVAGIISLGHTMGFDVISEGVEETEQLDVLRGIGCDLIQGFVWGRPLLPEDAEKLITD
ncbi:MAG: bifunctional diguanylate cyclase/phosphodiesterase [Lachnospiraceae bacterium]|nr:bifunctional diguanylate cyclase/phosphodiesterase [Lachnospiraceae bacterium]